MLGFYIIVAAVKKRNHEFKIRIHAEGQRSAAPSWWGARGASLVRFGWLFLVGFCCLNVQAQASKEYQLKAAFVSNFTKFVEWTPNRFSDENAPIAIGVFADSATPGSWRKR